MDAAAEAKDTDEPPNVQYALLASSYNQTYLIRKQTEADDACRREVLFRCGNWCYVGKIDLPGVSDITVGTLPKMIPALQKQQGFLSYYCEARMIPPGSPNERPLERFYDTIEFLANELVSDRITDAITNGSHVFKWINADDSKTHFELETNGYEEFEEIEAIASKTYTRGLVLIVIYFDRNFYVTINDGDGSQPLLDVKFPDLSKHMQGLQLRHYRDPSLKKLLLWHSATAPEEQAKLSGSPKSKRPEVEHKDVHGEGYTQTYIIRDAIDGDGDGDGDGDSDVEVAAAAGVPSSPASSTRDVLFRFGSWCYTGRVRVARGFGLADVPGVIPQLRMQQHQLSYACEARAVPADSAYLPSLRRLLAAHAVIEAEVAAAAETLATLVGRLEAQGFGQSIKKWLDGDDDGSGGHNFFELATDGSCADYAGVQLAASKVYHRGLVTIVVYYEGSYYVSIEDGEGGTNSLLDHRFPDVSTKSRGYQIQTYNKESVPGFPELRKLCLWQAQTPQKPAAASKDNGASRAESKDSPAENQRQTKDADEAKADRGEAAPQAKHDSVADTSTAGATSAHVEPEAKSASNAEAKSPASGGSPDKSTTFGGSKLSLPHHLPPMTGSNLPHMRMMAKDLGGSGSVSKAPWDVTGRPLGT